MEVLYFISGVVCGASVAAVIVNHFVVLPQREVTNLLVECLTNALKLTNKVYEELNSLRLNTPQKSPIQMK